MNRTEALSALSEGKKIRRKGGYSHWIMVDGQTVCVHQSGAFTLANMADLNDYELHPDNPHGLASKEPTGNTESLRAKE